MISSVAQAPPTPASHQGNAEHYKRKGEKRDKENVVELLTNCHRVFVQQENNLVGVNNVEIINTGHTHTVELYVYTF